MKLVELLARELNEWPCDGPATQDPDKEIRFDKPSHDFYVKDLAEDAGDDHGSGVEVTRTQWQAERDRQNGGEWKRHRAGRNQPVMSDVSVEVKLRCGDIQQGDAHEFIWLHSECDVAANIMQYRIISQPQAEEVKLSRTEARAMFMKPVIVYPEAKWDQIETPFKWRDEVTELNAYIEKFTRERDELINRLALEGFALIPAMTPVIGVADIDMSDWRNWKAGDLVSSKTDYNGQFTKDKLYVVTATSLCYGSPRVSLNRDDKGEANGWMAKNFEFHSRP